MRDEPQPPPGRHRVGLVEAALISVVILALYVLSAGPVGKLACEKVIPYRVLRIYLPLAMLNDIPIVSDAWEWYLYYLWRFPAVSFPSGFVPDG